MNTLHNSKESIDCSLSGGCAPNDYKTNEKSKDISDRFCASCTLPSGITCQERLFFFVNKYNYTKETATTKLLSDHEACAFTTSAMEFKTNDLCFITSNMGQTRDAVDKVPSVKDFSTRHGSKFFLFSNLEMDNDDGWNKIVSSDQEMKRYNRWTTHAKWPKFMGWKHHTIRSAVCKVIVWCDAYLCDPNNHNEWLEKGKHVLSSDGGLMQLWQPGKGHRGPEKEIAVIVNSGKLDEYLGNKTIDWLRSQQDYNEKSTVYKTAVIIYNPDNKNVRRAMERFWSVYSEENLGWRDQPFWSYFLSSEKLKPTIFDMKTLFNKIDTNNRGFGAHLYTIRDIAMNDTKILQTAKIFNVPWSEWMKSNVFNQTSGQELMTKLADKLLVKEWLLTKEQNVLSKMKIPKTYWNTTDVDAITLKNLPSSYVLKSNHASGTNIPVKNNIDLTTQKRIDEKYVKRKAKQWMGMVLGGWGELWYTNIKPRIFAEEFIEMSDGNGGVPIDYKVHVLHQQAVIVQACLSRYSNQLHHFYNHNFERIDIGWHRNNYHNTSSPSLPRPAVFDDMIYIAEEISEHFPYVRIDFYEKDGALYFSEFTFGHDAGKSKLTPSYIDNVLGYMLAHKESIPMLRNFSYLSET